MILANQAKWGDNWCYHTQIYNSRQMEKFFILQRVSLGSKRKNLYRTSLGSSHVQLREMREVLTRVRERKC